MSTNENGGPAGASGPAGPQAGGSGGQQQQPQNNNQQQQQQPQQQQSQQQQQPQSNGFEGKKLSNRPIIPDERFARPQPKQPEAEPEKEETLASKYGISLPNVPLEGTNTYTGVRDASDLSSNLPTMATLPLSSETSAIAPTGLSSSGPMSEGFGFTNAAAHAHNSAYGGHNAASSPEVMARKAAQVTTAIGADHSIAGM